MDRTRLMKFYAKLYSFKRSKYKDLKLAEELMQEAYDICMTEDVNTDNYSADGGFLSARTVMQMCFNALQTDVRIAQFHHKFKGDWDLSWYGFKFVERELSVGFFRDTSDQFWF